MLKLAEADHHFPKPRIVPALRQHAGKHKTCSAVLTQVSCSMRVVVKCKMLLVVLLLADCGPIPVEEHSVTSLPRSLEVQVHQPVSMFSQSVRSSSIPTSKVFNLFFLL